METLELEDDPGRYVSTGDLPSPDDVRAVVSEAYERYRRRDARRALARLSGARAGARATSSASAWPARAAQVVRRGRRRGAVHDHERRQAVRLRARLRGARARGGAATALGVNATGLPFNSLVGGRAQRRTGGRTRWSTRARSRRRASSPATAAEERWQIAARRPVALRRPPARARRRGLRVGVGDEPPQPGDRRACCSSLGRARVRPGRGDRPLHAAELRSRSPRATSP